MKAGAFGTALLLVALGISQVSHLSAQAATTLSCDQNTIYAISGTGGAVDSIDATTGAVTALPAQVAGSFTANNALGISPGGTAMYSTLNTTPDNATGTILKYNPADNSTTAIPNVYVPQKTYRGAVDPVNGVYYYAQGGIDDPAVYAYDTINNVAIGKVGHLPSILSGNGDLAFSTSGQLFLAAGATVQRVDTAVPTTTGNVALATTQIATLPSGTNSPGIAFSTSGYLYVASTTNLLKINPSSGALVSTIPIGPSANFTPTDLASCNYADSLTAQASIDHRWKAADQFGLSVTGNSIAYGNTATTSGTAEGLQSGVSATAGSSLVVAGSTYRATETAASGTNLADYTTTYACTNTETGQTIPGSTGTGTFVDVTVPASDPVTGKGVDVSCVFTNKLISTHSVAGDDSYSTPLNTQLDVASPGVLVNDSGTGNGIVSYTQPANGTVTLNKSTGAFSYVPTAGFAGTDTFTYVDQDSSGAPSQVTGHVSIIVGPTAKNDIGTVISGATLSVPAKGVLSNDGGTGLVASAATTPTQGGTVTLNPDGSYTYKSASKFSGVDTWFYTVTDAGGHTATAEVDITVKPQANDDSLESIVANGKATVAASTIIGNDLGSGLTVTAVGSDVKPTGAPSHGSVVLKNGGFEYTPATDYSGPDSFSYQITDGNGNTSTATETIAVTPKAFDDSLPAKPSGTADTIETSVLLSNDKGTGLTVTGVSSASNGIVSLSGTTVTFTPTAHFSGTASFVYTVTDGSTQSVTATATIPVNPTSGSGSITTVSGQAYTVDKDHGVLAGADGSALQASVLDGPGHGDLTLNADGSFVYTPVSTYSGPDSFTYTITGQNGTSTTGTETITVTPGAHDDTANPTRIGTDETILGSDLLGNDAGKGLSISAVSTPVNGAITFKQNGDISYVPSGTFSGTDTFQYTITDGTTFSTATVSVVVSPLAVTEALPGTTVGTSKDFTANDFLGNDLGTTLKLIDVSKPSVGSVSLTNGVVTYTPTPGFSGRYSFTYTVADPDGNTSSAVDTIRVSPIAGAPTAQGTAGVTLAVPASSGLLSQSAGSTLTVAVTTPPPANQGVVTLGDDGAYTFAPADGFSGKSTFSFTVTDPSGGTAVGTATVTVKPKAVGDVANAKSGVPLKIQGSSLVTNDKGTGLTITSVGDPAHGQTTLNSDGSVTYTPSGAYSGPDSFTYTVTDQANNTSTATVAVTVAVVAADDSGTTPASQALTVDQTHGTLSNDNGSTLSGVVATAPAHGTVALAKNGSYVYTPAAGFSGTDTFTYTATDPLGAFDTATVTIVVSPVATTDQVADLAGSLAHLETRGVLANDLGTGLTVATVGTATNPASGVAAGTPYTTQNGGTVTITADGSLDYKPASGYSGKDTFGYTVSDGTGRVTSGTVVVTVAPRAIDDSYTTPSGTALTITQSGVAGGAQQAGLLVNDLGTELQVTATTTPAHGTLVKDSNGSFVYTPTAGFSGTDSFVYTVTDGSGQTTTATARILVGDLATNYVGSTGTGTSLTVGPSTGVLSGDSGLGLTAALDAKPKHGTVSLKADGSYVYQPAKGFSGYDTFTYTATDQNGQVSTGVVTLTVSPTATNDAVKTPAGRTLTISAPGILSNDDGTKLIVTSVGTPSQGGTVTVSGGGALVYTPKAGFSGDDTFSYTVTDQDGLTKNASVTVRVGIDAVADSGQTIGSKPLAVDAAHGLLANDEGSGLTTALKTAPRHGTVVVNRDGSYTYTAARGFSGQDTFTYTVTDSSGQSTTAVATVNVLAAATAVQDKATGKPGKPVTIRPLANDSATSGANLDPSTLALIDPSSGAATSSFTIPGKGTFAVVSGEVTFTPSATFAGSARIGYSVSDSDDIRTTSFITVTYPSLTAATAPTSPNGDPAASKGVLPTIGKLAFTGSAPIGIPILFGFGVMLLGLALVLARRLRRPEPGPRRTGD